MSSPIDKPSDRGEAATSWARERAMAIQREAEHSAWRMICHLLDVQAINVNDPHTQPLVRAIKLWGEELVELRRVIGDPSMASRALDEARDEADDSLPWEAIQR